MKCDWCGQPAITVTFRTLYKDTEFENTGNYWECIRCSQLPDAKVGITERRIINA